MSVILVAEEDAGSAEQIANALTSEGWAVETVASHTAALQAAAARQPDLLLASTTLPEAANLLAAFSRRRGGPGSVALVPVSFAAEATAEDYQADEVVVKPCDPPALKRTVRRCLAGAPPAPGSPEPPAAGSSAEPSAPSDRQLTSADIFGDVLAEVEAEAQRSRSTRRQRARTRRGRSDEIERRLEETLSGVIPVGGQRRRDAVETADANLRPAQRSNLPTVDEIDDLLDKTLSSLDLSPRSRRSKTSAARGPAKPAPAPGSAEVPPVAPPPSPATPAAATPAAAIPPEPPAPAAGAPPVAPAAPEAAAPEAALPEAPPAVSTQPSPAPLSPEPPEALQTRRLPVVAEAPKAARPGVAEQWAAEEERAGAAPRRDADLQESGGETFGEYTLLERVAVGGMAEVWRARRRGVEGFQKTVAIKKILAHLTDSPDFVDMFIDEAKLAAQLNHHNIIQIYDLGKVGDDYFIAMEYVEGKDLRSILNAAEKTGRPVPTGLALLIVGALARALDYAHRKRDFDDRELALVHRDVSPQNVLISYEGEIKLCDFGIVKAVSKASTTQMGALKGKLQYMSPEQAWGRPVDARSDIFSLGSVLFEVLTGAKLFAGDSEIGVLDAVRECRIRSPREIVPSIPPGAEEVVLKALAKSPEDRYQTAGEMEHDLKAVLDGIHPTPSLKDLAAYLDSLFRQPAAAPSADGDAAGAPEAAPAPGSAGTPTPSGEPQPRRASDRRVADRRTGPPDRRAAPQPQLPSGEPPSGEPPSGEPPSGEPPSGEPPSGEPAVIGAPAIEAFGETPSGEPEAGFSEIPEGRTPETGPAGPPAAARRGRRLLAVAAVAALALAGAGWLMLRGPSPTASGSPPHPAAAPAAGEAAPAAPSTAAPPTAPPQSAEAPGVEAPDAETPGAVAPGAAAPGTEPPGAAALDAAALDAEAEPAATTSGDDAETGPFPADLEQLVAEEVSKRREQIERDFEEKKRRLEEEIAKTRKDEPEPADETGGGGGGENR